jgi:lactate 2-monooxygenase
MVFSNQASVAMETCAESMGESPRFFQLYWSKSRDLIQSFVQRAEKSGCKGIVLTLDTTLLGWRTKDLELAYLPFLLGKGIAQYTSDPIFQKLLDQELSQNNKAAIKPKLTFSTIKNLISTVNLHPEKGNLISKLKSGRAMASVKLFTDIYSNPALNWNDLPFLRSITKLPIILKGILNTDDALKAIDFGMNGIVESWG